VKLADGSADVLKLPLEIAAALLSAASLAFNAALKASNSCKLDAIQSKICRVTDYYMQKSVHPSPISLPLLESRWKRYI